MLFSFLFHFSMKFVSANRIAPDRRPRFAASNLGLSHKKEACHIWVKQCELQTQSVSQALVELIYS